MRGQEVVRQPAKIPTACNEERFNLVELGASKLIYCGFGLRRTLINSLIEALQFQCAC